MTLRSLRVAIVDESPARAAVLGDGLREAGLDDIHVIAERFQLLRRISELAPDVVLIDLESPSRDVLDEMFAVSRAVARPIAMFVDQSDMGMTEAAIDAGISAYVVDGLRKERIKAVLDLAIARFNAFARLQEEVRAARSDLADRKVIDRAKRNRHASARARRRGGVRVAAVGGDGAGAQAGRHRCGADHR
jgi:response regulator NasT